MEYEVWKTRVQVRSEDLQKNADEMKAILAEYEANLQQCAGEGSAASMERHRKRGSYLARTRLELLLDEDSPFLELMPFAGFGQEGMTAGGSVLCGIGVVSGVLTAIHVSVPTQRGGAMNAAGVAKGQRLAEIALQNRLPTVALIQTAGADLTQQADVFHAGGGSFRHLAIRSKEGLPTCAVVFGSSTAGGAYQPGMSDYTILVRDKARVFLGGPPLVRMATGEDVGEEELGGADMHAKVSGLADYLATSELDALRRARLVVHGWNLSPSAHFSFDFAVEPPKYDAEELLAVAMANIRMPYDCREVLARVVDGSRLSEFKPLFGPTMVCTFAHVHGYPVGILGNNGVIFSQAAQKATQFIDLCNQRSIPLLFFHNVTGFMVGKKYEEAGIIKHGAKLINAVANSGVPAISVLVGASYGAANYAMCGRAYNPRFLFSWPNSRCSVMGSDQLTGVLDIVMRQSAARSGKPVNEERAAARLAMYKQMVDDTSTCYYTSSRVLDDAIIDPRDTRSVLGLCLHVIHASPFKGSNHSGVSRL